MTSLIVKFPAMKIGEGGGVDARRAARQALIEQMKANEEKEELENEDS